MTKVQAPELLLINKQIYVASIKALTAFMENTFDIYEEVRKSTCQKEYKTVMLTILSEQIDAITRISQGIEASLETGGIDPDKDKAIN